MSNPLCPLPVSGRARRRPRPRHAPCQAHALPLPSPPRPGQPGSRQGAQGTRCPLPGPRRAHAALRVLCQPALRRAAARPGSWAPLRCGACEGPRPVQPRKRPAGWRGHRRGPSWAPARNPHGEDAARPTPRGAAQSPSRPLVSCLCPPAGGCRRATGGNSPLDGLGPWGKPLPMARREPLPPSLPPGARDSLSRHGTAPALLASLLGSIFDHRDSDPFFQVNSNSDSLPRSHELSLE